MFLTVTHQVGKYFSTSTYHYKDTKTRIRAVQAEKHKFFRPFLVGQNWCARYNIIKQTTCKLEALMEF